MARKEYEKVYAETPATVMLPSDWVEPVQAPDPRRRLLPAGLIGDSASSWRGQPPGPGSLGFDRWAHP